jgi:cystathionine beta-lyase/cystathionine gamma-synthase
MLRKEVQLWQKEILAMNSDFRQGLFTRAMMLTAKQEQSKDLSQWQTAMNSRMIRATSTGAVQAKTSTHATAVQISSIFRKSLRPLRAERIALFLQAVLRLCRDLLKSGDHVVFSSVTYIAVYRLLNELLKDKFGVETTIVDTTDTEKVKAAIRPNTKLIHIETPGNPTLSISDIEKIAELAHANGALLSVDNTFASPFNQRPIELGADFTVESLTKYINGHGDAMGGAIIGKKEYLDIIRAQSQINLGATISPFNAWLIMRGSVTLPLRMKQHNENALKVARYLKTVKGVSFVAYPGLEDHPNHDVAVKQMKNGFGGVLSFGLKADHDTYNRFVTHLKVITSAVSLGHDESLIVFLGENDERQYLYPEEFHNGFFRFSVGIEDAEDIIEDLRQAFEKENLI